MRALFMDWSAHTLNRAVGVDEPQHFPFHGLLFFTTGYVCGFPQDLFAMWQSSSHFLSLCRCFHHV